MIFRVYRVAEHSLYPAYRDGDFVIVSRIPILFKGIRAGDVVVFNHPVYREMIKKVHEVMEDGKRLFVVGENEESVDSRRFGPIPASWVLGVVVWHVKG